MMTSQPERPRPLRAAPPAPFESRLRLQVRRDLREEWHGRRRMSLPPGSHRPSVRWTMRTFDNPLGMLLDHYERFGPVFTVRVAHHAVVWAIGAQATHQILVSDADAFQWRESRFGDLWPLLGDSFFAIDGPYHQQTRRALLPRFHAPAVEGVADAVAEQAGAGVEALAAGGMIDINHWVRGLAMQIAMRVLAGIEAGSDEEAEFGAAFERALSFFGKPMLAQMARGPRTPFAGMQDARATLDRLIEREIDRRQRADDPGAGVLGLLLQCTDADGAPLPRSVIRDHLATVLFAGHDTTTATFSFMAYELGRHTSAREALLAELDDVLGGAPVRGEHLDGKALPVLERTIDETLRRFPPAWHGPRRAVRDVELAGVPIPAGTSVHYSSWANHHLPEYFANPAAFRPERFLPGGEVAQLPKGAYVPFGGGSRMCLGKRFAQYEIRAIAATVFQRYLLDPDPAHPLALSFTPTLGPRDGLRFLVHDRERGQV
jgi:cytochrome P450